MQTPAELAAPSPASARRSYIRLDMTEVAEELAQSKREQPRPAGGGPRGEALLRCGAGCRFFWTCCCGALHSMAPPALAAAEAATILAVYWAAVPGAWPTRSAHLSPYTFAGSAEDMVALSLLRCLAITLAHCLGTGPLFQRPYLLTASLLAAVSLPLGLMKLVALRHSQWPNREWPPFVALYAAHMAFAVAQVLAAQRIVAWARTRWEHGLEGLGYPWQEGEDTWLLAGQLQAAAEEGRGGGGATGAAGAEGAGGEPESDVPAAALADHDSRWAVVNGLRVHYKVALPTGQRHLDGTADGTAILLVHSFGGGAFSWRHLMQPLADACGLPVLAFDRPGFGLTERPAVDPATPLADNPYALKCQALLALQLCSTLCVRRVVLAGHGDGALLALLAAAVAAREAALGSPSHASTPSPGATGAAALPFPSLGQSARLNVTAPVLAAATARHRRSGSLPDSLDLAWMSSLPEGGHSVLQQLLRGEWPAAIEPRSGSAGGSLGASWAGERSPGAHQRRSPLRPRSMGRRSMDQGQRSSGLLQPFLEEEEEEEGRQQQEQHTQADTEQQPHTQQQQQQQQQQAGVEQEASLIVDNPSFLSQPTSQSLAGGLPSASTEPAGEPLYQSSQGEQASFLQDNPSFLSQPASVGSGTASSVGGLLAQQSSLIANPSFLSQTSDREQWEARRYSSQGGRRYSSQGGGSGASLQWPRRTTTGEPALALSDDGAEAAEAAAADSDDQLLELHDNPSFLAGSTDGEAFRRAGEQARQQSAGEEVEQQPLEGRSGLAGAAVHAQLHARGEERGEQQQNELRAGAAAALEEGSERGDGSLQQEAEAASHWQAPEPVGLVLLHPDLSGSLAPKYARVLAHSRLGRRVLRSLLRTEVGEVTNRHAWADPHRLTPELYALYRRPLHAVGWDAALIQVARARNDITSLERGQLLGAVVEAALPVLVATGEADHMVPPAAASRLVQRLGAAGPRLAVVPRCGHLSHEEAPAALLSFLQSFVLELGLHG